MGRPKTVTDDEILAVFDEKGQVLTAPEIAAEISLGNRGTLKRIHKLADKEKLENKKIGQTWVWWRSEHELSVINSRSEARALTGIWLPVQDDDRRIDIIRDCVDYIDTNGSATPEEVMKLVYDSGEIMKRETIKMALQQLHDDVVIWNEKLERWEAK